MFGMALIGMMLFLSPQTLTAQSFTFCTNCNGTTNECAYPAIATNPDINSTCANLDIVFILDESGSIAGYEGDVENGVMAFLNALNGTGVNVAIVEFGPLATLVTNYQLVNSTLISNAQGYFDGVPFNG
jgi:hypothetical protein